MSVNGFGGSGFKSFFRNRGSNKKPKRNFKGFKNTGKFFVYFIFFLFMLTMSFVSGFFGSWLRDFLNMGQKNQSLPAKEIIKTSAEEASVENVVERVLPALVGVLCPLYDGGLAKDFTNGFPFLFRPHFGANSGISFSSNVSSNYGTVGSGFFVKNENSYYILTNYHVVEKYVENQNKYGSDKNNFVLVILRGNNDEKKKAEVIGYDEVCDVAVLRVTDPIDETKISVLDFAKPESVKVGSTAVALGNPLSSSNVSVTKGIVSAKRKMRTDSASSVECPYIQTDAAINSGNSGGPLVNLNGEVIGMNTMKLSSANVERIAFAVSSEILIKIFKEIVQKGHKNKCLERPSLGISGSDVVFGDGKNKIKGIGVLIDSFLPNSAAKSAGLRVGNIIVGFNGKRVNNLSELQQELSKMNIGDEVELEVLRDFGEDKAKVKVKLGSSKNNDVK